MANKITLKDILRLTVAERLQLVDEIWASLAIEESAGEIPEEHQEILDRRWASYRKDKNPGIPFETVKRRLAKS